VATRKKVHESTVHANRVAIAPDGETIAVQTEDREIIGIIKVTSGQERCRLPRGAIFFGFAPDCKSVVTAGQGQPPCLWDAASGKQIRQFAGALKFGYGHLLDFTSDGKLLAATLSGLGRNEVLFLWDVESGYAVTRGGGHQDEVTCVDFAPCGTLLASGSHDKTVRLWDPATGKELRCLEAHGGTVSAMAFSHDGKTLASSGEDGMTRIWEVSTGRQLVELKGPAKGAAKLVFSDDSKTLIASSMEGAVHFWELASPKKTWSFKTGLENSVFAIPLNGSLLLTTNATAQDDFSVKKLRFWSTATGRPILEIPLHKSRQSNPILSCLVAATSAAGRMVAVGETLLGYVTGATRSMEVRLFELATGREVLTFYKIDP
jgi:WD40 repeat protein